MKQLARSILLSAIIASNSACALFAKPEPIWKPEGYVVWQEEHICEWVDEWGTKIPCDSPQLADFYLIRNDKLQSAQQKFHRCERWK